MSTAIGKQSASELIEQVVIEGDLAKLSPAQRIQYYADVCASLGLNPLTKPLEFIKLNGRLVLYAKRDATDQLRKIHSVSIYKLEKEVQGDVYVVTAYARDKNGKEDSDLGVVNVSGLMGDALANAMLKATTKAKRRVTLSICGLGLLDETEVETIPIAAKQADVLSEARQEREAVAEDPGEYVATFGRYKGQKLKDVDIYYLAGYIGFIEKSAAESGKQITGKLAEFLKHATDFIESRTFER